MSILYQLNIGIVGACRRGASFKAGIELLDNVAIHAACDTDQASLDHAATQLGAREQYTDFDDMLARSDLDAVIIATPMHLHSIQSIRALNADLHVLSEVTAAVSIDACRELVVASNASKGKYMMAENCNYFKANSVVSELVRQGLFGTTYYAEAEYLHEIKTLSEKTPWRRQWQIGRDGVTYGTHSLGPVLQWLPRDRVVSVCCAGSGRHYSDPRGIPYAQDTSVMLCRMCSGGLVKIRVDMLSNRPAVTTTYQLQGTEGCYESRRAPGECDRVFLRSLGDDDQTWINLATIEDEFLPTWWSRVADSAANAGHNGSDLFAAMEFVDAIRANREPSIGIHTAMDMTLPGLISQMSVANNGEWLDVPDSRAW